MSVTSVAIEALAVDLRQTEKALVHWRAHAKHLHEQVRTLRKVQDEASGAPRSVLPLAGARALTGASAFSSFSSRPRENSVLSTTSSLLSASTRRVSYAPSFTSTSVSSRAYGQSSSGSSAVPRASINVFMPEYWDPKLAEAAQRREDCAALVQRIWRGLVQRRRYRASRAFFAIVNGAIELRSGWRTVPAYTLTVVRAGHCWQVSHRFSDWLELHKHLVARMPEGTVLPALPARMPFNSTRVVSYRQFALNRYLQELFPLVVSVPRARRTLLSFLSRSHTHWLYALVERQQSLYLAVNESHDQPVAPESIHLMRSLNGATIHEGEVRDASTGHVGLSMVR